MAERCRTVTDIVIQHYRRDPACALIPVSLKGFAWIANNMERGAAPRVSTEDTDWRLRLVKEGLEVEER